MEMAGNSMAIEIIDTTREHLTELSKTIREADKKEINCFGITIAQALLVIHKEAVWGRTALIDGKVGAIWGLGKGGSDSGQVGKPFLLTSKEVLTIPPITFVRIYKKELDYMLQLFPKLVNYVDSTYNESIKLLRICGFTIGEPEPFGINGHMFRKFSMECGR